MLLAEIARTSEDVRATSARGAKVARLVECLAALAPDEVPAGVAYLSGRLLQRQTGAGWASLRDLPPPGAGSTLTVLEVDAAFARMAALAGPGSIGARRDLVHDLFARAGEPEQRLLRGLIAGELRQGAQEGVMIEAAARAAVGARCGAAPRPDAARRPGRRGGNGASRRRGRACAATGSRSAARCSRCWPRPPRA